MFKVSFAFFPKSFSGYGPRPLYTPICAPALRHPGLTFNPRLPFLAPEVGAFCAAPPSSPGVRCLSMAMGKCARGRRWSCGLESHKLACAFLHCAAPQQPHPVLFCVPHTPNIIHRTHVFCLAPVVIVVCFFLYFFLEPRWRMGPGLWDGVTTRGKLKPGIAPSRERLLLPALSSLAWKLPPRFLRNGFFDEQRTPGRERG